MKQITNSGRAEWAEDALNTFIDHAGEGLRNDYQEAIGDLIADLCHLAQSKGADPLRVVHNGLCHYACEAVDPKDGDGMGREARAAIEIMVREYGTGKPWQPWQPKIKRKRSAR